MHSRPEELQQLVAATANRLGRAEAYIEKDYYAMAVLREVTARNPKLVFKGGTCLSKAHRAIERFSEDVDLGIAEEHATEGMRKTIKYAVVESAKSLGLGDIEPGRDPKQARLQPVRPCATKRARVSYRGNRYHDAGFPVWA